MQFKDRYGEADATQARTLGEGVVAVELIVHGVGGAPPTDLLDDFHPTRVSGDRHAGFYRPQVGPVRPAPGPGLDPPDPAEFPREAYAWGGLTSADAARSLWFLLLPYALMNMAGWMLPRTGRRGWVWSRGLTRVLAALGTVTMVLASAHLTMDLVGYQCGWLIPSCRDRWWLSFLQGSFWSTYPSRIVVLAAAIPLLVLAGVWAVGLVSFRNFEEYVPEEGTGTPEGEPEPTEYDLDLEDPWFWKSEHPVRRLRRLHFQLGVVLLAVVLGLAIAELTTAAWPWQAHVVVWGGTAVTVVLLGFMATPRVELSGRIRSDVLFRVGMWVVAGALLALAAWYGLFDHGTMSRADAPPRLEAFIPVSTILTWFQLSLGVMLAIVVWKAAKGSFLRFGPAVAYTLGWFMIMSLWAGLGIRMASFLESGQADSSRFWITDPSTCTFGSICYPIWFEDAAVAVTLLLAATIALGAYALLRAPRGSDRARVTEDFGLGNDTSGQVGSRRYRKIVAKLRYQRIVAGADAWMAGVIVATLVFFLWVAVVQDTRGWRFWPWLVTVSGWVVALVPIVTVLVVRAGLNNPTSRRAIGAVFDVLTFFPRRVHPFAPPCYGERAVPQLRWRLGFLIDDGGESVLARSHSQGTVVTAAAILQGAKYPERVWLLTCGSPMVALYQRHFPYYFHDIVDRVAAGLRIEPHTAEPRWLHVGAATDILGAPLRCDGSTPPVQIRVLDPTQWGNLRPGDPPPSPLGHGCYHHHPVVDAWVVHQLALAAGRPTAEPEGGRPLRCAEPAPR